MASIYDLVSYDSEEDSPANVPLANLTSAAFFIAGILERADITYGLMGGLAVRYIGGSRNTKDVDVAFQSAMRRMWEVVEGKTSGASRLKIPNTRLISNIMKVFVRTGPGFNSGDGVSIVQRVEVEVYLIQHGYQNSPRDLSTNFMIYTIATNSGTRQIKGISLLYLLRGKMAAFANRREDDDVQDIQTILLNRRDEVKGFVGQLDPLDVEVFLESVPERTREHWKGFFKQ